MVLYNLVFIPLQFGYRIPFNGIYLLLEVFTILLYGADIYFRVLNIRMLLSAQGNINSEKEIETELMEDKDQFARRIYDIKVEIFCSAVALVPFSFIFETFQIRDPVFLVDFLCLLRLLKFLPFLKMFEYLKSKKMQKWRVIEVVVTYFVICHIISGIWI